MSEQDQVIISIHIHGILLRQDENITRNRSCKEKKQNCSRDRLGNAMIQCSVSKIFSPDLTKFAAIFKCV